jgi:sec-independent protein translocase protein TatA
MPFNLGIGELLLVMVIFLLVFGAKRLPEIGGAMGKGIREFKKSMREVNEELDRPAPPPAEPRRLQAPEDQQRLS